MLDLSSLFWVENLFSIMPYKIALPSHSRARGEIVSKLKDTCERRAVAIFGSLQCLLPIPLIAIAKTSTACDMSLFVLIFARHLVDGSLSCCLSRRSREESISPRSSVSGSVCEPDLPSSTDSDGRMSATGLLILGFALHVIQAVHFYCNPVLLTSPYGFCSNIFVLLVTGFTSYSVWVTVAVCVLKNASITALFLSHADSFSHTHRASTHTEYFYAYWSSCAIVLTVVFPTFLETVGRITAEAQAAAYKAHIDDLLRASFDACVWVDSGLRVAEKEPRLDFLFGRSMLGRSLLAHVEDRQRFESYMSESLRSGSTALFHTSFLGAELFQADVYVTARSVACWLGRQASHQHLVGVRVGGGCLAVEQAATGDPPLESISPCDSRQPASAQSGARLSLPLRRYVPRAPLNRIATPGPPRSPSYLRSGFGSEEGESAFEEEQQHQSVSQRRPSAVFSWECPECFCVNKGVSKDQCCILCGAPQLGGAAQQSAAVGS